MLLWLRRLRVRFSPPFNESRLVTRYYLHLRDSTDETLDPEGLELLDLEAVKTAALAAARDLIANDIESDGVFDLRYRIDAEDDAGQLLYRLPFKDAVRIIPEMA